MVSIDVALKEFLNDQQERLKQRTYNEYASVIDLFRIYLNSYAYNFLEEEKFEKWKKEFESDEDCYTKLFEPSEITSTEYSDFLGYFVIRKVTSCKSFMKQAVRVMKKYSKWLLDNDYIDPDRYDDLKSYFADGQGQALSNAEKVADLIYEQAQKSPGVEYESLLDDYFTVTHIQSKQLWFEETLGTGTGIGPVVVSEKISDLCEEGWDINPLIGKYNGKWYIIESGQVYP